MRHEPELNPNEPHRVCTVDLSYVLKQSFPNLETARVAADEAKAKYGGLWFAAHHSYFKPKVDRKKGHNPITAVNSGAANAH